MSERLPAIAFKSDPETTHILDTIAEAEGRSRSDVIRRALRLYGERAGLVIQKPKPKPIQVSTPRPRARKLKGGDHA